MNGFKLRFNFTEKLKKSSTVGRLSKQFNDCSVRLKREKNRKIT